MEKVKEFIFYHKKEIVIISLVILLCIILSILFISEYKDSSIVETEYVTLLSNDEVEDEISVETIFVDIKGEIKTPGVYEMENGERVIDLIEKAGGLTDKSYTRNINLSKILTDECVVIVNSIDEINVETIKCESVSECVCEDLSDVCLEEKDVLTDNLISDDSDYVEENKIININKATEEELMALPGIGESKANNIIEYRNENKFNNIDDIKNVSGIGDSVYEKIKDLITVE